MVTFHGERVRGKYVLFRTGGKNWMIHRMDPPEDPDREPMPERVRADAGAHRARCRRARTGPTRSSGTACARSATPRAAGSSSRAATATTSRRATPSCARSAARSARTRRSSTARSSRSTSSGRPSFQRLQRRMHLTSEGQVRRLSRVRAGRLHDLRPAVARRALADGARPTTSAARGSPSSSWPGRRGRSPAYHVGNGAGPAGGHPRRRASKASSPSASTAPTSRAAARQGWVKVKNVRNTDVVVGGWVGGDGGRAGQDRRARDRLHAEDGEPALRRQGRHRLHRRRAQAPAGHRRPAGARRRRRSPAPSPRRPTHFIEPSLVASVDYGDDHRGGTLRHPVYKGLRDDLERRTGRRRRRIEPADSAAPFVRRPSTRSSEWGMPRSMWSGAISFGLVNVPIKLYSAVSKKTVRFHQLNGETGSRIAQKRVDSVTGEEVPTRTWSRATS